MAHRRVVLSRQSGWKMPPNAIKVDRSTRWGNPWRVGDVIDMKQAKRWGWTISPAGQRFVCADAEQAVAKFFHCLLWDEAIHDHVRQELGGHDLACWCTGQFCHAEPLIIIANSTRAEIRQLHEHIEASEAVFSAEVHAQSQPDRGQGE